MAKHCARDVGALDRISDVKITTKRTNERKKEFSPSEAGVVTKEAKIATAGSPGGIADGAVQVDGRRTVISAACEQAAGTGVGQARCNTGARPLGAAGLQQQREERGG